MRKLFVNIPTMTRSNDSVSIIFRNSFEWMLTLAASSPVVVIVESVPRKLSAIPAFFVRPFIWAAKEQRSRVMVI